MEVEAPATTPIIMLKLINNIWYQKNILSYFLFPFSAIYLIIICVRKFFYKIKLFKSYKSTAPIIIVGNITVGGTGKTPLVIAFINELKKNGFHPGVITRGYGGKNKIWPCNVTAMSDPFLVGDEAVLIAKHTQVPVMAGSNRANSVRLLEGQCDVIVSDDGLQHYALQRDIEIAVIDATRKFGNGFCLPAGPLREPISRLKTVDFIVTNGAAEKNEFAMEFVLDEIISLQDENKKITLSELKNKKITAVAGIGNPDRFFSLLKSKGVQFSSEIFPDHYVFTEKDFKLIPAEIILMTEKDAVKCRMFSDNRLYAVQGHASVDRILFEKTIDRIRSPHK